MSEATQTQPKPIIRIGGVYPVKNRDGLRFRVTAFDTEHVRIVHLERGREFAEMDVSRGYFERGVYPEDESMIPELVGALEDMLDALPKETDDADWWPDELRAAVRAANVVLAKADGRAA